MDMTLIRRYLDPKNPYSTVIVAELFKSWQGLKDDGNDRYPIFFRDVRVHCANSMDGR